MPISGVKIVVGVKTQRSPVSRQVIFCVRIQSAGRLVPVLYNNVSHPENFLYSLTAIGMIKPIAVIFNWSNFHELVFDG